MRDDCYIVVTKIILKFKSKGKQVKAVNILFLLISLYEHRIMIGVEINKRAKETEINSFL